MDNYTVTEAMDDELILRICNQIQDTLASERENAANVLKADDEMTR